MSGTCQWNMHHNAGKLKDVPPALIQSLGWETQNEEHHMARSGNQDWTFCRKSARVPLPSQTNYFYHSLMQDCSPIASSRTSTGLLTSTYQGTAMYTGRCIFANMDSIAGDRCISDTTETPQLGRGDGIWCCHSRSSSFCGIEWWPMLLCYIASLESTC